MTHTNVDRLEERVNEIMNDPWITPFFDDSVPVEHKKTALRTLLTSALSQARQEGRGEVTQKLVYYTDHRFDCIHSQLGAGRPTEDGGYEQEFAGVWYESRPIDKTPKCDCGLDQALQAALTTEGK